MPQTTDATLRATLADRDHRQRDLYTFGLASGDVRFCSGGAPFSFGGRTWVPAIIERGSLKALSDTSVETLDLIVRVAGWPALGAAGDLNDIEVLYEKAYTPDWVTAPSMLQTVFIGRCRSAPTVSPVGVSLSVRSYIGVGEGNMPPRVIGPSCSWRFGDSRCGASLGSYTTGMTLDSGSTTGVLVTTGTPGANAMAGGTILFTASSVGLLNERRTVAAVNTGSRTLTLTRPLPALPAAGDTINVIAGCPRNLTACETYGRLVSYGGFPGVPKKKA